MALFHQIRTDKPEATKAPAKPRKQQKLTVSTPANQPVSTQANLIPGQPCPCCGRPVKWDRKEYQKLKMRERRASGKA